jgi:hypothetical protein
MNAQRRLEEFIFKLGKAQNGFNHAELINELKNRINLENQKININVVDRKSNHKTA